jgi:hypothetical protein
MSGTQLRADEVSLLRVVVADELIAGDKLNLDITWLRDSSLGDPDPDELRQDSQAGRRHRLRLVGARNLAHCP